MTDFTRETAYDLLAAVFDRHRSLDEALTGVRANVPARDRAAGHRLAATVLRRTGTLDALIEPFLKRDPPHGVRHILRLGAAAAILLDAPAHAAVGTAVELANTKGFRPFAGLVNAVLRRVTEAGRAALIGLDGPRLDTPPWLWAALGADARAIATAHQSEAPLDLTPRPGAVPPEWAEVLSTGSWRFAVGTAVPTIPGFGEGEWWVQDAAAAMPARLLDARARERVCDLCAAPGGKTLQLATTGAAVTALDADAGRLPRLRENLIRTGLIAEVVHADALTWAPAAKFDAILLDAPCTATGTIRRHPDVPHLKRASDLPGATATQDALIAAAGRLLKPGGRLVYAVCSLLAEEGRDRVEHALRGGGWTAAPFTQGEMAALPEARTAAGNLRTHPALWPDRGGMDGFFAARLIRG